jgi:hypothetical protein
VTECENIQADQSQITKSHSVPPEYSYAPSYSPFCWSMTSWYRLRLVYFLSSSSPNANCILPIS